MNKYKKKGSVVLLGVLIIMAVSCIDPAEKYRDEENLLIETYLSDNPDLDFVLQSSGLYYLETLAGTGISPATYDSVFVNFTAKRLDGTIFGTNIGSGELYGFIINVGENIPGFDQGIMLMKEAGKATILLPSNLAFGSEGAYYVNIPGYTPVLYDIELVDVKPVVK